MTITNRTEAQQRADEIRVFAAELSRLESDGVLALDATQREAVAAHHQSLLAEFGRSFDIDRDSQAKQLSLGMRVASFLGALALAASVFFLFYQFWGWFAPGTQVVVLIAAALASFAGTVWLQGHDSSGYFTKLAAMVTFACFVLNITMLGQIFNITPSDKALLPWAAFAFLLAYAFDLRLLLAAGIFCLLSFMAARVGAFGGTYWIHFGQRPENFLVPATLMFFVPHGLDHRRFAGFASVYRVLAMLAIFLPVLILSHWGWGSYLTLERKLIEGIYQTLGLVGAAAFVWYGVRRHLPEVVNTGVTWFVIFLYSKMFDWWWEIMPKYQFFLVIGLTAMLLLFAFRRLRESGLLRTGGTTKS
ncbi:MAG: DUF2157 domain-containing protein [Betaproteobacteria bacterium]|nr:DUF2157 domain-containing protein [Betaproteobacteria bacterium]